MKIHNVEQGSVDWALLRAGIPTASEFDNLITPEGRPRTGEMRQTYLCKKLAEWWTGGPLVEFNTFDMEQGRILESEALPWFELESGLKVQRVGFITDDAGRYGCSPDAWIPSFDDNHAGAEVKCPMVHTHIKYLLGGGLPKEYAAQVQGSMFVTGAKQWMFLSYRRRIPNLVLTIDIDEKFQAGLRGAMDCFLYMFEESKKLLIERNGGPPRRFTKPQPVAQPAPEITYLQ